MPDKKDFLKTTIYLLIVIDAAVWALILFSFINPASGAGLYFFDVGQGDSSMVELDDVQILIDGGPANGRLLENLEKILPENDRYIDLILISHPQTDHFGGLVELFKNYKIGAVATGVYNGSGAAWEELISFIKSKNVPALTLNSGDKIKYKDYSFFILSPDKNGWVKDINNSSLVALFKGGGFSALFTGDIGADMEGRLADLYNMKADVLKVSHHGSKFSSSPDFIKEINPAVAIIEVGKNSYGHPTKQTLNRLADVGSQIFRTDEDGLIKLSFDGDKLKVYSHR